ncbi:MAG: hypothetical protein ACM3NQ_04265 [Bacteroidales bacterium]
MAKLSEARSVPGHASAGQTPTRAARAKSGGPRLPMLLVLLFVVSLPAVTPRIYAADEVEYFAFLRSLWFDRDLAFGNEYQHFYESGTTRPALFFDTFLGPASLTQTGRHVTFATIGPAILWAPFYAVADAGVRVARLAGSDTRADGYSRPYVAAVAYGSAVYGFLALLLGLHACRLIVPGCGRDSIAATLAVWLGTPLLFYMYVAPPFSHATSAFAVAAFVTAWLHVRRRWSPGGTAALGALAALMAMVREQDVLIAAGAAADFALTAAARMRQREWREARALATSAGVGAVAAIVAYLPQAAAYMALNGHLGPSNLVTRKLTWTAPHAWQVLGSPEHGFLFWTPLAILAIAGLVLLAFGRDDLSAPTDGNGDRRRVVACLLLMVALQVYVAGSIESWTVAGAFGQRRFVGLSVMLVVGVGGLLAAARAPMMRRAVVGAILLGTWWNLALMIQFGTGLMDRQRLTPASNAWNAFVVVPARLPVILYRYAFDRSSFYAAPRQ